MMLAPHPISFSVDGRPSETSMVIDGVEYVVVWDGKKLHAPKEKPALEGNLFIALIPTIVASLWLWALLLLPFTANFPLWWSVAKYGFIVVVGLYGFWTINHWFGR